MRKITIIYIVVFAFFSFTGNICAQVFLGPVNLGFTQACASPSFNTFTASINFDESNLNSDNQFIILLSDATGSFANPTEIIPTIGGGATNSPATLTFAVPETVSGEAYSIRVRSTSPQTTSTIAKTIGNNTFFPAYFKSQDEPFTINNLIATASYCSGGSYTLTIDNPGTPPNISPLKFPELTFNWFRQTGITTSVFVASGETLTVNQPGTYFVDTNYGTCTSNSTSNRVTVSQSSGSTTTTTINSSLGNPFCLSDGDTTLSTTAGDSYQWFKDNTPISGATNQTYVTSESGNYSVDVSFGSCMASASIDLDSNAFTSNIDVLESNIIEIGETLVVTVSTTANNPEYQWSLNGSIISGETASIYEATQEGSYMVTVTQTTGCISSNEIPFEIIEAEDPFPDVDKIPNLVSPNGDDKNDTWVIPREFVSGTNSEIMILSSQGKVVFETNDYQNNWPDKDISFKDVNPVYYYIITTQDQKMIKGSITVIK